MRRSFACLCVVLVSGVVQAFVGTPARAQDVIRIGIILPYSGQFADMATQMDNGIRLYVQRHGDMVAGKKLEFIRKDVGGIAPDVAKRLAQELVIRDKVDILAGFIATPNAMAAAEISQQAKKLMVIMNAGTSIVTTKSPYAVRTSFTIGQVGDVLGTWAAKRGAKKSYTIVSDYAPGHDVEGWFQRAFKAGGGEVIGTSRVPVTNPDFSPFVQRVKDVNPESIFIWVPGGAQPAALGKAMAERGINPKQTMILGTGEITDETSVKNMGEASIGIFSAWHYDYNLNSPTNAAFVQAYNAEYKRNPDFVSVGGYDGMHLIYESLNKTGGSPDVEKLIGAAKGMAWESPRGPISIDPETRNIIQTIYIREVRNVEGGIKNVVIDKFEKVKDPILANVTK